MINTKKALQALYIFSLVLNLFAIEIAFSQPKKFDPKKANYLWPTNSSRLASATLGETRSAHFHAGLDVKTWGRVGYELYASRDGILYRVAKGPFGYGNVIYLKHDDGSFTVYAHMDRFTKKLDQLVDSLRWKKRVFVFDQNMEKFKLRYKQGELIGYTGESGAGPPHLHFEIRSPIESPVNALITNLSVKDRTPPQFSGLAIEPLDKYAKVEGKKSVYTKSPSRLRKNYNFGTIDVTGQVGLAVDVFDQADGASNALAVYELELIVNEKILFHSRVDSFSYSNTREMFLDRVYELLKKKNKGYQRLYKHDGNTLPFYDVALPEAKLNLEPGLHDFEIIARDFFGNTSKAFGKLRVHESEALPEEQFHWYEPVNLVSNQSFPEDLSNWKWQNDWVLPISSTTDTENPLQVHIRSLDFYKPHQTIRLLPKFEQVLDLKKLNSFMIQVNDINLPLFRIKPGVKTVIYTADQLMKVEFGKNAVYDTLSLSAGYYSNEENGIETVYILPEQEPLKRGFSISFVLNDSYRYPEKTAFYTYNFRTKRVDFANSNFENGYLSANLRDFGFYQILTDTVAPELSKPRLYRKSGGRWIATLKGSDNLSGINYNASRFWVNDEEGILEYDPEEDKIVYYHPDFKPNRNNTLRVEIIDNVGNKRTQEFTVSR